MQTQIIYGQYVEGLKKRVLTHVEKYLFPQARNEKGFTLYQIVYVRTNKGTLGQPDSQTVWSVYRICSPDSLTIGWFNTVCDAYERFDKYGEYFYL